MQAPNPTQKITQSERIGEGRANEWAHEAAVRMCPARYGRPRTREAGKEAQRLKAEVRSLMTVGLSWLARGRLEGKMWDRCQAMGRVTGDVQAYTRTPVRLCRPVQAGARHEQTPGQAGAGVQVWARGAYAQEIRNSPF